MKRHLLFFILLVITGLAAHAQSSLLATLSHNGTVTTYVGNTAFSDAYNAAIAGDIITLSSGQFNAISLAKPVTIRGAGMYGDNSTIINGNCSISEFKSEGSLVLEGLAFNSTVNISANVSNVTFLKSYLPNLYQVSLSNNLKFIHCDIDNNSGTSTMYTLHHAHFSGCRIVNKYLEKSTAENCLIICESNGGNTWGNGTKYTNTIIQTSNSQNSSSSKLNTFLGCVYIGPASNPLVSVTPDNGSNRIMPANTKYLKEGTTTYELLDELQTSWLGTDGTQVGMHGGTFPFDPTTTNPQIKKFNVSAKTSTDGKLSVEIEIDIK